ncbi:MAG: response regulator transcription factor [Patescibacteria group bacterium]
MDKKKILVVEDEVYLVELYTEILQKAGYQVSSSYTGDEGIKLAEQEKFDLILLDLMLPSGTINGTYFLHLIKTDTEKYHNPLVVVLTNLTSEVIVKDIFSQKADGFLMKTELTPEQIVKEVKNYLSKS